MVSTATLRAAAIDAGRALDLRTGDACSGGNSARSTARDRPGSAAGSAPADAAAAMASTPRQIARADRTVASYGEIHCELECTQAVLRSSGNGRSACRAPAEPIRPCVRRPRHDRSGPACEPPPIQSCPRGAGPPCPYHHMTWNRQTVAGPPLAIGSAVGSPHDVRGGEGAGRAPRLRCLTMLQDSQWGRRTPPINPSGIGWSFDGQESERGNEHKQMHKLQQLCVN